MARRPKALQAGGSTRVPRKVTAQETLPVGWTKEGEWRYQRQFGGDVELAVIKINGAWRPLLNNRQLTRASGFVNRGAAMRATERLARNSLTKALTELDAAPKKKGAK